MNTGIAKGKDTLWNFSLTEYYFMKNSFRGISWNMKYFLLNTFTLVSKFRYLCYSLVKAKTKKLKNIEVYLNGTMFKN